MNEIVERVAEALWQDESMRALGRPRLERWIDVGDKERDKLLRAAGAAIAALREPTDAMAKAGMLADDKRTGNQACRHIYRAMIEAALKPRAPLYR